jgi:hypothetical protein
MGFSNPIIGGGGSLVYPSIHSPNFLTGISGWTIRKDGSVEFNLGIFRGVLELTSAGVALLVYNGTPVSGNLIYSVANADGTDGIGNAYKAGSVSYFNLGGGFYLAEIMFGGAI